MVLITMIWGITFVMVKNALNDVSPFIFATLRFGLAFILGAVYLNKELFKVTKQEIIAGIICGFLLFLG